MDKSTKQYLGLIIFLFIVGLLGFIALNSEGLINREPKFISGEDACEDIGLIKNGFYFEYPPLRDLIEETEFKTSGEISSWSSKGEWKGCSGKDNCDYIECSFPARLCFPSSYENGYCQNIELNLIVDYPVWKEWKKNE